MGEIVFSRGHALGKEALRARLAKLEVKLQERYGVKLSWQGDTAMVSGPGVSGAIKLADQEVAVDLKLGLMMRPLASQIREALERQIERALA